MFTSWQERLGPPHEPRLAEFSGHSFTGTKSGVKVPNMNARVALLAACLLPHTHVARASLITLVDESFTVGTAAGTVWTSGASGVSLGQQWTWSSPVAPGPINTEVWTGTAGASARAVATTYDHDQNAGTAAANIPGGFEVMSSSPSITVEPGQVFVVSLQLSLPTELDASLPGTTTFFAANRLSGGLGGRQPRYSVFNVTENRDILPEQIITYPLGNAQWNFKEFLIPFAAADAGDIIQLRFKDQSGSGARGMEVADVTFSVTVVPEPSSASVLLLGLAILGRRLFERA